MIIFVILLIIKINYIYFFIHLLIYLINLKYFHYLKQSKNYYFLYVFNSIYFNMFHMINYLINIIYFY